ncbi:hypothetical protein SUNI508_12869 [Seiridium unicorne]|uniref:Uncharacterized protein n=1 Tax=Seiridium unicorne TaxID=138068 RepID=A0ABR2VFX6_9PEZI
MDQQRQPPDLDPDAQGGGNEEHDPGDEPDTIVVQAWTLDPKATPYLFNLSTTAVCAILQLLLVLANLEAQHQILVQYQVWRYLFAVLPRVLLTTMLAFASTYFYEYTLAHQNGVLGLAWCAVILEPQKLFMKLVAGLWKIDITMARADNRREELRRMRDVLREEERWETAAALYDLLAGAWEMVADLSVVVGFDMVRRLVLDGCLGLLQWSKVWGWEKATNLIQGDEMWVDRSTNPGDLWSPLHRVMGQVVLQLVVAAVLLQIMFLYRFHFQAAKEIHGSFQMMEESRPKAVMLQETVTHLVTLTAHQVVRFAVPTGVWAAVPGHVFKGELVRLLRTRQSRNFCSAPGVSPQFKRRGGACAEDRMWLVSITFLTLAVNLTLRYTVRLFTRLGWRLCEPIFVWRTIWIREVIARTKPVFLEQVDTDLGLDRQVKSRAMLTFLFPSSGPLLMMIRGGFDVGNPW